MFQIDRCVAVIYIYYCPIAKHILQVVASVPKTIIPSGMRLGTQPFTQEEATQARMLWMRSLKRVQHQVSEHYTVAFKSPLIKVQTRLQGHLGYHVNMFRCKLFYSNVYTSINLLLNLFSNLLNISPADSCSQRLQTGGTRETQKIVLACRGILK